MPTENETQVFIRTSERSQFAECRQHWYWSYVKQRKPRQTSAALMFGDLVHRALAAYYIPETRRRRARGPHPATTFDRLCIELERSGRTFGVKADDKWEDARDLGSVMMHNYIDQWGDDKHLLVLYPEMPFQYNLLDREGNYVCTYVGTTDALIYDLEQRGLGLFEHKTAASINTSHLFLDEQAGAYWCIIPLWLRENGLLKPTQDLEFMLYNFMRKSVGEGDRTVNAQGVVLNLPKKEDLFGYLTNFGALETFTQAEQRKLTIKKMMPMVEALGQDPLQLGQPSKNQPPPLFHREIVHRGPQDRANVYQRIMDQADEMYEVRHGLRPALKSPGKACSYCEWRDLCEVHECGGDWKRMFAGMSKPWEPYEQHVWALELGDKS
jgi:hypothetical protein